MSVTKSWRNGVSARSHCKKALIMRITTKNGKQWILTN